MAEAEAAVYCGGEEEIWKCPKHPTKRRRHGICATCLRDRLAILCPHCAQVRPCPCVFNSNSASSSASSSSSSVGGESFLRRSRSLAIPFLRSSNNDDRGHSLSRTPSPFLSVFRRSNTKRISELEKEKAEEKGKKATEVDDDENSNPISNHRIQDYEMLITRSRSVSASTTAARSRFRRGEFGATPAKTKFWRLPLKIFRG